MEIDKENVETRFKPVSNYLQCCPRRISPDTVPVRIIVIEEKSDFVIELFLKTFSNQIQLKIYARKKC
jgi:hypothetical protein